MEELTYSLWLVVILGVLTILMVGWSDKCIKRMKAKYYSRLFLLFVVVSTAAMMIEYLIVR